MEGRETGKYITMLIDRVNLTCSFWCFNIFYISEHHRPPSAVVIGRVLREHHEDLVAYMDGCLIQVTNHLFSAGIVTEHIQRCVSSGFFSNASIVAMECQLCVTLDHDPESKLEEVLNVFDQVESPGPDVASMIQRVSIFYIVRYTCHHFYLQIEAGTD